MILSKRNSKSILVVDDDAEIRKLIKEALMDDIGSDVVIIEASDGYEAAIKINHQKFDCILTDIDMPKKEGDSLIKLIRVNALNKLTPVIIVSGSTLKEEVFESFDFVHLISKPFATKELTALVLNQLSIGANDKRVSADVMNNLIKAICDFIEEVSKKPLKPIGDLEFKPAGLDLSDVLSSSIKVKIGDVVNTFSILVKEDHLKKLSHYSDKLKHKAPSAVLNALSYVVLKHVMDQSGLINREKFNASFILHDDKILKNKAGVLLTLGSDEFEFKLFASTR